MKIIIKILFLSAIFLFSSLLNPSFANDDVIKFKLIVKPKQQQVLVKIDGDEHNQIQIRAEYIKLNTITNNHQIKIIISNNSGQILYHQLALIDKVEHSEIKYSDSTIEYIKYDDGKQISKMLPYYNYGNIKANQATPRYWYISNTGKDEIVIKGYIIKKEIPVVVDTTKITDPGAVATLTRFLTGLHDNDLDMTLSAIAPPDIYLPRDLHKNIIKYQSYDPGYLLDLYLSYADIRNISENPTGKQWIINSWWTSQESGKTWGSILAIDNINGAWLITEY